MKRLFSIRVSSHVAVWIVLVAVHFLVSCATYDASQRLFVKGVPRDPWPIHGDAVIASANVLVGVVFGPASRDSPFPYWPAYVGWMVLNSVATASALWFFGLAVQRLTARRFRPHAS